MPITPEQFQAMQQRLAPKTRLPPPEDAVEHEIPLHNEIIEWLKSQYPQPAYIHARTDKRSSINKGAPDFFILLRGNVYLIECKARTGKRTPDQLAWALLAEMSGFKVHEVRSMSQFLEVIAS